MDRAALIAAMQETAAAVMKPEPVDVPVWGRVYVKALTVGEIDANSDADARSQDKRRLARSAARVMCDESGARLFDPDNDEDVALITAQPWSLLQRVVAKANDLNAQSEKGAVEAGNA